MLRHFLDQFGFKRAVDLVFGAEPSTEVFEFLLLFPRQHTEAASRPNFKWLREEAALPSSVLGPVECCALAWFAARCASVDMLGTSQNENAGEAQRLIRRSEISEAKRASEVQASMACQVFGAKKAEK